MSATIARWFNAEPSPGTYRRLIATLLAGICALAIAQVTLLEMPRFPVDDAYITLHNAQALNAGSDPSFPGISPLAGATSIVHLGLVAALDRALPTAWALWLAGWLAIIAYAAGIVRLAQLHRLGPAASAGIVTVALFTGEVALQLVNGLETGLALAAVVWAFALLYGPEDRRRLWMPLLAGQLPFLRPELGLLAAFLLLELALRSPRGGRWRTLVRSVILAGASTAPWLASYWLATGSLVPLTVPAKRNFFSEGCFTYEWKLSVVFHETVEFLSMLGSTSVGIFLLVQRRFGFLALLFFGGFLSAYFLEFPGALDHFDHRYLTIVVPLALLGLLFGLTSTHARNRRATQAVLALSVLWSLATLPGVLARYRNFLAVDTRDSEELAEFINQRLPVDARLLVHDIGYLSTAVPRQLVDIVGLKNPRAAHLHRFATWESCGEKRALVLNQLALETPSPHLVVLKNWDRIFELTEGLRELGWRLEPLRPENAGYQVYRLGRPREPTILVPQFKARS